MVTSNVSNMRILFESSYFRKLLYDRKYMPPSPIEISDPLEMICYMISKLLKL